jgi:hypothetical protein
VLVLTNVGARAAGYYSVVVSNAIEVVHRAVGWVEIEPEVRTSVGSGFESDAEGWSMRVGQGQMRREEAGGNPGGYLRAEAGGLEARGWVTGVG